MHFFEDDASSLARLAQLTEKTNQFNVKKRPFSEGEIREYIDRTDCAVFYAKAIDQFGDQGIIAFALVRKGVDEWHIESLLMSCRVIGRGIEEAFVAEIARRARAAGAERVSVTFEPSEKNEPARAFVDRFFGSERSLVAKSVEVPDWITVV